MSLLRPRPLEPVLELSRVEAEHVRAVQPEAAGELAGAMPAEDGLGRDREPPRHVGRPEEALSRRRRPPSPSAARALER